MKFIDEVHITVGSGKGGDGRVGFRREKFAALGGPDGGDGGRGGHIYFEATHGLNTLMHFRGRKNFFAQDGDAGAGSQCSGKSGEDLYLKVPCGTIISDQETGQVLADLTDPGQTICLAEGGRGGLGNKNFKSSTNQAPRYATEGKPGSELALQLELKLLADIALIGLPNAGKSTLISSLSSATPKVADYPFTTLEPQLGVVELGEKTLVLADIPGLIEDASEGKGLGIKFLKHIERTKAFVHLIDCSMFLDEFEAMESYAIIRTELEKYHSELLNKKELVCITKIDAMSPEEIEKFQNLFQEQLGRKILPLSSVSGENKDKLKELLFKLIDRT